MKCTKKSSALADWPAVPRHDGMENFKPEDREPKPGRKEKGRLRSGPHKVRGPDRHVGSSEAKKEKRSIPSSPQPDNMRGNTASDPNFVGWKFRDAEIIGTASDYFHKLALDTLQLSVYGHWDSEIDFINFLSLREQAIDDKEQRKLPSIIPAPDGSMLTVLPHGGHGGYKVLIRGGDPLEIRACAATKMPPFIFRFGARWCVERSREEIGAWTIAFLKFWGYEVTEIRLSEVHIRCDTPSPFVKRDLDRLRGVGLRNGSYRAHFFKNQLSGLNNLGGSPSIQFAIYNKRLEQQQNWKPFWPAVWHCYGIPEKMPIWRVEARWKRPRLKQFGLGLLEDLTEEAVQLLWFDFAVNYLYLSSSPKTRKSRDKPTKRWAKIAACGEYHVCTPIEVIMDGDQSRLAKVLAGVGAKLAYEMGQSSDESLIDDLVRGILYDGLKEEQGWLLYDRSELTRLVEMAVRKRPGLQQGITDQMIGGLVDRITSILKSLAMKRPFSQRQKTQGESHV